MQNSKFFQKRDANIPQTCKQNANMQTCKQTKKYKKLQNPNTNTNPTIKKPINMLKKFCIKITFK